MTLSPLCSPCHGTVLYPTSLGCRRGWDSGHHTPLCLLQGSSFSWLLKDLQRNCGILYGLLVLRHGRVADTDKGVLVPSLHPPQQSGIWFQKQFFTQKCWNSLARCTALTQTYPHCNRTQTLQPWRTSSFFSHQRNPPPVYSFASSVLTVLSEAAATAFPLVWRSHGSAFSQWECNKAQQLWHNSSQTGILPPWKESPHHQRICLQSLFAHHGAWYRSSHRT